eukprot:5273158-Alexandrium_andersonii.AAC.1
MEAGAPPLPAPLRPEVELGAAGTQTLAQALNDGVIAMPGLPTWNEWQAWRAEFGARPPWPANRAVLQAFQRREVELWRQTMAR